ncbi:MAG: hypothetical protein H0W61_08245 [Bacteroidetes bacterium]|nr:hypothetical protein [Bacteroidota bacterium]
MESKEEIETFKRIIAESNKKLSILKIVSNFFNHSDLIAILIRTKVIHNLFENNRGLDINKLELFHIQFTNSLLELLQKLKRSKEQKYLIISDEIYINEGFISRLKEEITVTTFPDEVRAHSQLICKKLEELYKILAGETSGRFVWSDILTLSRQRGAEFYREISEEQYKRITSHNDAPVYQSEIVTLEKKLAGKLNIQKFKVKLVCGLHYKNEFVEVMEFVNSNDKFIFITGKKSFYLLDENQLKGIDLSKNQSNRKDLIDQLTNKNAALQDQLIIVKTVLPDDVEKVLESYLSKISGVDFLDDLQNVDEQTNILKAMLNINIK